LATTFHLSQRFVEPCRESRLETRAQGELALGACIGTSLQDFEDRDTQDLALGQRKVDLIS